MPRRSKRIKTARQSGGKFGNLPRKIVVDVLKFFDIHEVARLQRLVCHEFRDAGQERIHERGGRKLFEEGLALLFGLDYKTIDKDRGRLMIQASRDAGCKTAAVHHRTFAPTLSDEDKQKLLKDSKEIGTSSPYHWVSFYIGVWYARGFGGEEKKNQAVVWLEKAAHKGNAHAMHALGNSYDNGMLGLTQSDTKANELYTLAADKGHAIARYNLGYNYKHGKGVAIDFTRCLELFEQSAKQGYVNAQYRLCGLYQYGSQDGPPMTIPINHKLDFKWCMAAAENGHAGAMNDIGVRYENNGTTGVDQNLETALGWYIRSAVKGNSHGQNNLGTYYEEGKGTITVDLVQALHWFQEAAAQELPRAQFSVGYFYEHGRGGVEVDLEQALHWYQKAAAQEHTRAMEAVARLS